jgi:uncharacterized membrane protein YphA (DoxX/SURF4 family)
VVDEELGASAEEVRQRGRSLVGLESVFLVDQNEAPHVREYRACIRVEAYGSLDRGRGAVDALFLIGRILFGLLFVVSGLAGHLAGYQQLKGYAAAKKIPFAGPAVLVSGVVILLGGIGVAAGVWADVSSLAIAVFLFFTTFFIHNFWTVVNDAMMRLNEMTQFQKDLALLGAAVVFFAVTAYGGEFGPTLTDPLFDL